MKNTTILKLLTAGLLILATTVFLAACSSSADVGPGPAGDAAEHVDDSSDAGGDASPTGDADTDPDAEEHSEDTDEPDPLAYLEEAPKDSLFLVKMAQLSFTPNVIEVKAGEVVEITIQNSEATLHDFTIDEIDADVHISYLAGTGVMEHREPAQKEPDVHFALTEAGSGVVHLKVNEPGEYQFRCSVPGHTESGMFGTLIVTEA